MFTHSKDMKGNAKKLMQNLEWFGLQCLKITGSVTI